MKKGANGPFCIWCDREDSNLHPLRDQSLKLAWLPLHHGRIIQTEQATDDLNGYWPKPQGSWFLFATTNLFSHSVGAPGGNQTQPVVGFEGLVRLSGRSVIYIFSMVSDRCQPASVAINTQVRISVV